MPRPMIRMRPLRTGVSLLVVWGWDVGEVRYEADGGEDGWEGKDSEGDGFRDHDCVL